MGAGDDILRRMAEFEATMLNRLDDIDRKVDRLAAHLGADRAAAGTSQGGAVAPVSQIRGERGNPKIGKAPKNWDGPSFEGCVASECSPDYLDFHADFLDWKASNPRPGKEKYAQYDRADAARCRRWAIEIREGRYKQEARVIEGPPPAEEPPGTVWTAGNEGPPADDGAPPPDGGYGDDDQPF